MKRKAESDAFSGDGGGGWGNERAYLLSERGEYTKRPIRGDFRGEEPYDEGVLTDSVFRGQKSGLLHSSSSRKRTT